MDERKKFFIALLFFVAPGLFALVLQKEFWPFSHYPMFSSSKPTKKFGAIKVFADYGSEQRQFDAYEELFPLGPQCTIKLLVDQTMKDMKNFSPNLDQENHLRKMSLYYADQAVEFFGKRPQGISIVFESYDYEGDWRKPIERKRIIWREEIK